MKQLDQIFNKIDNEIALNYQDALRLLTQVELLELASLATTVRQRLHAGCYVTFHIDTNPNYTNICDTACTFCAFYRAPKKQDAYWLTVEQVMTKIAQAVQYGARTVLLQGGHHPKIPLAYYVELIQETRRRFPQVLPHFFSAPEIQAISKYSQLSVEKVLQTFYDAGQRTLPGGGAEILSDRVRQAISPLKGSSEEWLKVHEIAHHIGFKTTATMMYGHIETPEEIIEHLLQLRSLQLRTGGFYAFIPWSFKPGDTLLGKKVTQTASEAYYLRILAVARLVLDNIPHIQASWFSEGQKTGQLALEFGADDFGGTLFEENVLREADYHSQATVEEVLHLIYDAGFIPVQRDGLYQTIQVYDDLNIFKNRILPPYDHFEQVS
jgi:cyclic dehypoxanthinyl futalosine synthase